MAAPTPPRLRSRLVRHAFAAYVSEGASDARRALARWRGLGVARLTFFHEVGDPYSDLVAQRLPALAARRGAEVDVCLVPPPEDDVAPERGLLEAYARVDATRLSRFHGLAFPASPVAPGERAVDAAARYIAAGADAATRFARIDRVRSALHQGDVAAIEALPGARASEATLRREREHNARRRGGAGHYLGAVVHDGVELYWGVDRLDHLERSLGGDPAEPLGPSPLSGDPDTPVDVFFSFRSPYSHLAIARIVRGPRPSRFRLRPVLPMVMRGLAVPRIKRMYIIRDAAREARRHDIPFGFGVDPVGPGVERVIALYYVAEARGLGLELAASAFRAIFAEGVDVASDEGLSFAARRVGLDDAEVRAALEDSSWRERVETNRRALIARGLWGVPSFVRGDVALWGQDRLSWLDPRL